MSTHKQKIAIIGAGQAGLQLGIHLLKKGNYDVSLYTDRSAKQVREGRILSSQGMFDTALQKERFLGLNFWDKQAPKNTAFTHFVADPISHDFVVNWQGKVPPYQSIDQRIKFSDWMNIFEKIGGKLFIQRVDLTDLDLIAKQNSLTIVATGKGEMSQLFARNNTRSAFEVPQRKLACLYVHGISPSSSLGVRAHTIPGIGDYFTIPGLTLSGKCEMMLFEGIPGGDFDCWENISEDTCIQKAKKLLQEFLPWEAERCKEISLTDNQAYLTGQYTPIVRNQTAVLPCGKLVLGLGDAVVLNDPIAGQGANYASKTAYLYAEKILERKNDEFDKVWMEGIAELAWNIYGKYSVQLSTLLLLPPSPYVASVLHAAGNNLFLANALAKGFDDPSTLTWLFDESYELHNLINDTSNKKSRISHSQDLNDDLEADYAFI